MQAQKGILVLSPDSNLMFLHMRGKLTASLAHICGEAHVGVLCFWGPMNNNKSLAKRLLVLRIKAITRERIYQ